MHTHAHMQTALCWMKAKKMGQFVHLFETVSRAVNAIVCSCEYRMYDALRYAFLVLHLQRDTLFFFVLFLLVFDSLFSSLLCAGSA